MIKYHTNTGKLHQRNGVVETGSKEVRALAATDYKEPMRVAIPVLTPDRLSKRQNGRRMKDNGDDEFTLTAQDIHGIAIKIKEATKKGYDEADIATIYYPKYDCNIAIRRLTPKEYFRLQGWSDDYFERAAFVNSNSQLYKQAGNGVTVNVIQAIAERMNVKGKDGTGQSSTDF